MLDIGFGKAPNSSGKKSDSKTMKNQLLSIERLRTMFSKFGVVNLCLNLLAPGIDNQLSIQAMRVLVLLLLKRGGCTEVQMVVYKYLKDVDSVLFFEYLKDSIGACAYPSYFKTH